MMASFRNAELRSRTSIDADSSAAAFESAPANRKVPPQPCPYRLLEHPLVLLKLGQNLRPVRAKLLRIVLQRGDQSLHRRQSVAGGVPLRRWQPTHQVRIPGAF